MAGVLLILIGLGGVALGFLGRNLLPLYSAAIAAGVLLLAVCAGEVLRSVRRRRVISVKVLLCALAGLVLLDFVYCSWLQIRAALGQAQYAMAVFPYKAAASFALAVLLPVALLASFRFYQTRRPGRYAPSEKTAILWDFGKNRIASGLTAVVLVALAVLAPLYGGWPPLLLAVRCQSVALTRLCLWVGADANGSPEWRRTPLEVAVQEGDEALVDLLVNRGADPNRPGPAVPPLALAVTSGRPEVVRLLLEGGADPNVRSVLGPTLHLAALGGHVEIARLLLAHGAAPDQRDSRGKTAAQLAPEVGQPVIAALLEEASASPPTGNR
jgi:ankyrin repeat protein